MMEREHIHGKPPMKVYKMHLESGYKRTLSDWTLEQSNVFYIPRGEHVEHMQDISSEEEGFKMILTLESGTERIITQHDLDNDCLEYCKYREFIRKITRNEHEQI